VVPQEVNELSNAIMRFAVVVLLADKSVVVKL
jgi:hypothetical protein